MDENDEEQIKLKNENKALEKKNEELVNSIQVSKL